jgi:hypothetical protein
LLLVLFAVRDLAVVIVKGNHEVALVEAYCCNRNATLRGLGVEADDDIDDTIDLLRSVPGPAIIEWLDQPAMSLTFADYSSSMQAFVLESISTDRHPGISSGPGSLSFPVAAIMAGHGSWPYDGVRRAAAGRQPDCHRYRSPISSSFSSVGLRYRRFSATPESPDYPSKEQIIVRSQMCHTDQLNRFDGPRISRSGVDKIHVACANLS